MTERAIARCYRNTMVCIDSYENEVMQGRIYNCYLQGEIAFRGLMGFMKTIEQMLDNMKFPQAYEKKRSFCRQDEESCVIQKFPEPHRGEMATFELKIFFRQNVSWQGTLCWLEEYREESFRSVLELCLLMDSALNQK